MTITRKDLENLVENIYQQVEKKIGITRWQFVQMAGHGERCAHKIAKNPSLKTIISLMEKRDELLEKKKKGLL